MNPTRMKPTQRHADQLADTLSAYLAIEHAMVVEKDAEKRRILAGQWVALAEQVTDLRAQCRRDLIYAPIRDDEGANPS